VRSASADYLLVVTNKELSASRGDVLRDMYPAGKLEYPSLDAEKFLPLSRIYVLSVEDFERLMSAASGPDFDLLLFLRDCETADSNPSTSVFYFEQHLDRDRVPRTLSPLVTNAIDDAEKRLTNCLRDKP
jgi:hypothetical protein